MYCVEMLLSIRSTLRIDLSVGQAGLAKACVLERIPYWGLALSERHCRKVEVVLTDFVLSEMRREGSSHYRPECVVEPGPDGATDGNGTNKPTPKPKGGPKQKPKTAKADQADTADTATGETDEGQEPALKKPRKAKNDKKEDEEEEKSEASSLPW